MDYVKTLQKFVEDKIKKRVHMNAAAALITKEGENGEELLLLIQRSSKDHWPHHWEFPRGKCDKGPQEDLLSCLKREVKEETGLDVVPHHKVDDFQYIADKGKRLTTCHNFHCYMKDPNQPVKLSHEHDRYKWIQSVGEAELMVFPDQKKTIEKFFNRDKAIVSYPENDFTVSNRIKESPNVGHAMDIGPSGYTPEEQEEEEERDIKQPKKKYYNLESYLDYLQEIPFNPHIAAVVSIPFIISWAHKTYKNTMTKAHRACRGLKGSEKAKCMTNYRYQAVKGEVKALKNAKKFCEKTKDPLKCKYTIDKKIQKLLKESSDAEYHYKKGKI